MGGWHKKYHHLLKSWWKIQYLILITCIVITKIIDRTTVQHQILLRWRCTVVLLIILVMTMQVINMRYCIFHLDFNRWWYFLCHPPTFLFFSLSLVSFPIFLLFVFYFPTSLFIFSPISLLLFFSIYLFFNVSFSPFIFFSIYLFSIYLFFNFSFSKFIHSPFFFILFF